MPISNASSIASAQPATTIDQAAILLDYIRRNQPCTIGEALAESGCGCMDKGVRIIKGLVASGELALDEDGMTLRLLG